MSQAVAVAQLGTARPLRVGAALAGVVLAAVLLFSLGVMTGARIAGRAPEPPASAPAAAPPAAAAPAPTVPTAAVGSANPGNLTFYDRLSGAAPPLPQVKVDEPPGAPAAATASAAAPGPPPLSAAPPERPDVPTRDAAPAATKTPETATPAGNGALGARVRKLMGKGPWAVQVAAVTDRAAAAAVAGRLGRQGLPCATVSAVVQGRTWHRLRLGSFPGRDAAARAAGLLRAEMGLEAAPVRQ